MISDIKRSKHCVALGKFHFSSVARFRSHMANLLYAVYTEINVYFKKYCDALAHKIVFTDTGYCWKCLHFAPVLKLRLLYWYDTLSMLVLTQIHRLVYNLPLILIIRTFFIYYYNILYIAKIVFKTLPLHFMLKIQLKRSLLNLLKIDWYRPYFSHDFFSCLFLVNR